MRVPPADAPKTIGGFKLLPRLLKEQPSAPLTGSIALIVLSIVLAVVPIAAANQLKWVIDALSEPTVAVAHIRWLVAGWTVLLLASAAATPALRYVSDLQTQRTRRAIEGAVAAKAAGLDLASFDTAHVHELMQRAQHEASSQLPGTASALIALASNAIGLAVVIGALLWIAPAAAAILIAVPLMPVVLLRRRIRETRDWQRQRASLYRRLRYVQRLLTGRDAAAELRFFGLGPTLLARAALVWRDILDGEVRMSRSVCRLELLVNGGFALTMAAGVSYAAAGVALGTMTVGSVVMVLQLLMRGQSTFGNIQRGMVDMVRHASDFTELTRFLALPQDLPETDRPVPMPAHLAQGIVLEHVSFSYAESTRLALDRVSLTIPAGRTVALVGPNGSGKSTLVKLLCRLYDPREGRVTWDGTDLRDFRTAELRQRITGAFQDHHRFEFSVRENIWLGQPALDPFDPAVEAAAQAAGADGLVARLPGGYETPLGKQRQGGEELSAGQWQLLAVARAFVRDAPLMLLDEPSSALDAEAEFRLFERLLARARSRTTIFVSHHFSTVRRADMVVVLQAGRVVEQGTHDELMANNGLYARMFGRQASQYR